MTVSRVSVLAAAMVTVGLVLTGCGGSAGGGALGLDGASEGPTPTFTEPVAEVSTAPEAEGVSESAAVDQEVAAPVGYRIGDTGPGGGIVFYDAGSPQAWGRYLEVAPVGWSGTAKDPRLSWCTTRNNSIQTRTAVGAGAVNTEEIAATCAAGASNTIRAYTGGGKTDWFLPSKDELNILYQQRFLAGGLTAREYWTSSQEGEGGPWHQNFYHGNQDWDGYKGPAQYVRPVRAF